MSCLHQPSCCLTLTDGVLTPIFDSVIVVPGVYDRLSVVKDENTNPNVAPWIQELMDWLPSDSRLIYYRYKSDRLFSARWSREVVRDHAMHILRSLSRLRSIGSQVRTCLPMSRFMLSVC